MIVLAALAAVVALQVCVTNDSGDRVSAWVGPGPLTHVGDLESHSTDCFAAHSPVKTIVIVAPSNGVSAKVYTCDSWELASVTQVYFGDGRCFIDWGPVVQLSQEGML